MLTPLAQALILLAGSVFLITVVRRLSLPTSLAYLLVGLLLGPHALGVISDSGTTRLLAELGVAFLLFTLGLDFSLPRMLAMRREVFGLGALQVLATTAVFAAIGHLLGIRWLVSVVLASAVLALIAVFAVGRWLLRPLFHEISHSRLRELFTLTVLLVVLASAFVSHLSGLSFALGAFLAGMMLCETEYRYQIDAAIRPFRDLLLGLFFVSVGMLLNLDLLGDPVELAIALLMLVT